MKAKKIAGSIIFVAAIIALWQLLYVAGTEWFSLFKPYAVPYPLWGFEKLYKPYFKRNIICSNRI